MDEQRLCSECGRYEEFYSVIPRYIGGQGYVEIITCIYCRDKTQQESNTAVEKLKERVKMGKLDAIRRLFAEYAADPDNLDSAFFAHEVYNMCTKGSE